MLFNVCAQSVNYHYERRDRATSRTMRYKHRPHILTKGAFVTLHDSEEDIYLWNIAV